MPLGAVPARLAAMERNELDGMVIESATGFELEEQGKGRNILFFGDIEKHFYTHVIYATDEMIAKRPELLRRFLRGWFKTVAFMKANKAAAVKIRRQASSKSARASFPRSTIPRSAASPPTAPGTRKPSTSSATR